MEVTRSEVSHFTTEQQKDLQRLFARVAEGDVGLTLDADGEVSFQTALPTADPEVAGALWANSGVVTVSAG